VSSGRNWIRPHGDSRHRAILSERPTHPHRGSGASHPAAWRESFPLVDVSRVVRDWMVRLAQRTSPGLWAGVMCRNQSIDEKLLESINSIGAVVNLGAGSDIPGVPTASSGKYAGVGDRPAGEYRRQTNQVAGDVWRGSQPCDSRGHRIQP
jgi:Leucine carboxyl methyltransferase